MTVSELGAYLGRHREERGWTLEDVEAQTRIRKRYIVAMEAGDWDSLPPGVYTRGLLRNYARALGVSVNSVLRMYVKERPSEARPAEPQLISQPLTNEPRISFELVLAGILLVVAVGLIAWVLGTQLPTYLGTSATAETVLEADPTLVVAAPASSATPSPTSRLSGRRVTAVPQSGDTEASDPAAPEDGAPERQDAPTARATAAATVTGTLQAGTLEAGVEPEGTPDIEPGNGLVMEVTATGDAWVLVRADGREVYSGFVREGESRVWRARQRMGLRTGNAGGTQITLNGQELDALGPAGDVQEREWRLLPNGDIEQRTL